MTRDDIIRMAREAGWNGIYSKPLMSIQMQEEDFLRFAALVAVQVEATWQNRYLKLMDLMKAREGQPNKPCCLTEREKFEKLIDELTNKSLHAQLNAVAAEREACAKVCEEEIKRVKPIYSVTAENCVKAIRARSTTN